MVSCGDFLDLMGNDMSAAVMKRLRDPADLVRVSSVSRTWRKFVVTNNICKELCLELFPETSMFTCVQVSSFDFKEMSSCSKYQEWKSLETEHKIYARLARSLLSPPVDKGCIQRIISASSTDNYPYESIDNTIEPCHIEDERPSYWSSEGKMNTEAPDTLTYCLSSRLCIVHEVNVHPFQADFQAVNPIYSAKAVRIKLGYSKVPLETLVDTSSKFPSNDGSADENYVWTYISPAFPMMQQNELQIFKLPQPVLCIGGILQIELLGRVQKQQMDALYYICVCHVEVVGRPLQEFDGDINIDSGQCILKYFPKTSATISSHDETPRFSSWPSVAVTRRMGSIRTWGGVFLGTLLVNGEESDASDEE